MILTDTGPIIALLDRADKFHQHAVDIVSKLPPEPMLTTWPCFTEAMYILGANGGIQFQNKLWNLYLTQSLQIHKLTIHEIDSAYQLMNQYSDTPMDLADASLVALAESQEIKTIFSFDSHFYIYRLSHGQVLQMLS